MKKAKLFLSIMALAGLVAAWTGAVDASAAEEAPSTAQIQPFANLDVLDKGELEGMITPYIIGVPNTGKITLHHTSTMLGVGLLDKSYFVISMPKEFKYISAQGDLLAANIKAKIQTPLMNHTYTMDEMDVMADRITFKNPRMNYVLKNKVKVDVEIDYGKVLDKYPNIPIADAFYEFKTLLSRNDMIDLTLLGNTVGHWTDTEGKAIIKD